MRARAGWQVRATSTDKAGLHLLWLTEHYYPRSGGMARSCDRIVYGLRTAGVTIDVAHLCRQPLEVATAQRQQGRDLTCGLGNDPAHGLNSLWNVLALDPHRAHWTHVVAFGGLLPLLAGPVYAAWLARPLVTLLRGNDFAVGLFTPGRDGVLREALHRSAQVCAVSQEMAWKIATLYPAIEPVWTPNGLDLEEWTALPSQRERAAFWRHETVEADQRVLGLFGQIKPKKGVLFFGESLLASGQASRCHLLIVGEIDEDVRLWLEAHADEIAYTLVPFIDRSLLPTYYLSCDLVAIPSLYDGLPNVLLEAAGLGVPVLAAETGGMADLLIDGEHGFLFPPGDTDGCCRALVRALAAPRDALAHLGERCRELVHHEFSTTQETERYLAVLRTTVASREVCRQ